MDFMGQDVSGLRWACWGGALVVGFLGFDLLAIILLSIIFTFDSYNSSSSAKCLPPDRTVRSTLGGLCPGTATVG